MPFMVSNPGGIYAEEKVCDKHNHGIEKNEKTISNVPINLLYLLTKKKKKNLLKLAKTISFLPQRHG
jgi:hypothetical protein